MGKLLLTVMAVISINSLVIAQTSTTDFRGFNWGSSPAQVKATEQAHQILTNVNGTDDVLVYEDQLAGSDVNIYYQFNDNDKLINGTYFFTKKYTDPQLNLQDYNKFKELLTLKYGKPEIDKEEWSENTVPFEKVDYGQAISDGYLDLITVWSTNSTIIKVSLLTLNNRPSLQIRYNAKSPGELENKEALKTALPKL
jgi:hypothetical protein